MLARIFHIMAFFGGAWGIALSLTFLISLNLDAFPFLTLLALLNSITLVTTLWRRTNPQWLITSWVGVGILLSYFVYLSRFSIGIYLIPAAGLTLFAGILAFLDWSNHIAKKIRPNDKDHSKPSQAKTLLPELTSREREVLILIAEGKSNQAIAEKLVVSPNTIRHHVHQILKKLNCSSRGEAAALARAAGLVT